MIFRFEWPFTNVITLFLVGWMNQAVEMATGFVTLIGVVALAFYNVARAIQIIKQWNEKNKGNSTGMQ